MNDVTSKPIVRVNISSILNWLHGQIHTSIISKNCTFFVQVSVAKSPGRLILIQVLMATLSKSLNQTNHYLNLGGKITKNLNQTCHNSRSLFRLEWQNYKKTEQSKSYFKITIQA